MPPTFMHTTNYNINKCAKSNLCKMKIYCLVNFNECFTSHYLKTSSYFCYDLIIKYERLFKLLSTFSDNT